MSNKMQIDEFREYLDDLIGENMPNSSYMPDMDKVMAVIEAQYKQLPVEIPKTDCFGGSLSETIEWFKQRQRAHNLFGSRPLHILSILEAVDAAGVKYVD